MEAYKTAVQLLEKGELHLSDLPFEAGEEVEVILLRLGGAKSAGDPYPLRGKPIRYEAPTEPVAEDDWEALP